MSRYQKGYKKSRRGVERKRQCHISYDYCNGTKWEGSPRPMSEVDAYMKTVSFMLLLLNHQNEADCPEPRIAFVSNQWFRQWVGRIGWVSIKNASLRTKLREAFALVRFCQ